jgi:hypothetical protein
MVLIAVEKVASARGDQGAVFNSEFDEALALSSGSRCARLQRWLV